MSTDEHKFWMIVNLSGARPWKKRNQESAFLPEVCRPRGVHFSRKQAEGELSRLKETFPGGNFILMESAGWDGVRDKPQGFTEGGMVGGSKPPTSIE